MLPVSSPHFFLFPSLFSEFNSFLLSADLLEEAGHYLDQSVRQCEKKDFEDAAAFFRLGFWHHLKYLRLVEEQEASVVDGAESHVKDNKLATHKSACISLWTQAAKAGHDGAARALSRHFTFDGSAWH